MDSTSTVAANAGGIGMAALPPHHHHHLLLHQPPPPSALGMGSGGVAEPWFHQQQPHGQHQHSHPHPRPHPHPHHHHNHYDQQLSPPSDDNNPDQEQQHQQFSLEQPLFEAAHPDHSHSNYTTAAVAHHHQNNNNNNDPHHRPPPAIAAGAKRARSCDATRAADRDLSHHHHHHDRANDARHHVERPTFLPPPTFATESLGGLNSGVDFGDAPTSIFDSGGTEGDGDAHVGRVVFAPDRLASAGAGALERQHHRHNHHHHHQQRANDEIQQLQLGCHSQGQESRPLPGNQGHDEVCQEHQHSVLGLAPLALAASMGGIDAVVGMQGVNVGDGSSGTIGGGGGGGGGAALGGYEGGGDDTGAMATFDGGPDGGGGEDCGHDMSIMDLSSDTQSDSAGGGGLGLPDISNSSAWNPLAMPQSTPAARLMDNGAPPPPATASSLFQLQQLQPTAQPAVLGSMRSRLVPAGGPPTVAEGGARLAAAAGSPFMAMARPSVSAPARETVEGGGVEHINSVGGGVPVDPVGNDGPVDLTAAPGGGGLVSPSDGAAPAANGSVTTNTTIIHSDTSEDDGFQPLKRRRVDARGVRGLEVATFDAAASSPKLRIVSQSSSSSTRPPSALGTPLALLRAASSRGGGTGATIDLTNDDDERAARTPKKPADEEVCLGMINVHIDCTVVPSPKPGQTSLVFGDNYWPAIKIVLSRQDGDPTSRVVAKDYTRAVVGPLAESTCTCLAPIMDAPGLALRTEARIPTRPKKHAGEEPGKTVPVHRVPLEVVLYAKRPFAVTIGRHLQVHHLRLVAPSIIPVGTKMCNPHTSDPRSLSSPSPSRLPLQTPRAMLGSNGGGGGGGGSTMSSLSSSSSSSSSSSVSNFSSATAGAGRQLDDIRTEVMSVFDSLAKNDELPERNPSDLVTTPLLKHQRQGLYFMLAREEDHDAQMANRHMSSIWKPVGVGHPRPGPPPMWLNIITSQKERSPPPPTRGGILADMMGLGKTLSILSLVATTYPEAAAWAAQPPEQPPQPRPPRPGSAAAAAAAAAQQQSLGLTRLTHNAKTTLLICPLSTVANWEEQIKQHIAPGRLQYHIYHGPNRIKDTRKLADFDLVITTYGSVSSELSARSKGKAGAQPLEEIGWFRIVLDEAHMIREHNTLMFKAVYRLQANRRWAVTGTPVQNRLDDFAALLAFLRLKPFDDRSKFVRHIVEPFKGCDPEVVPRLRVLVDAVTLRRLKDKINLPPRTDEVVRLRFSPEERHIYDLFAKNAKDRVKALAGPGVERALGGQTYIHILRSILRLRLLCAHGKDLLNQDDLDALQGMTADMAINLDDDDDDGTHSALGGGLSERQAYEMFRLMQETNNDGCVCCGKKLGGGGGGGGGGGSGGGGGASSEDADDVLGHMNPCFHVVCRQCFRPFVQRCRAAVPEGAAGGPCPVCNTPRQVFFVDLRRSRIDVEAGGAAGGGGGGGSSSGGTAAAASTTTSNTPSSSPLSRPNMLAKYGGPHTKTRALVEELVKNKAASAQLPPGEPPFKSVVFSGWTSHLDLIQIALDRAGIKYTRLDGSMTRTARTHAMDSFRDDASVQVILVSIMAGGLGLNLTAGNSCFVMEPQYNPAAEAQAVDRVHRLGQKRPVRTVRFIMHDSFEEKMLELQDKKKKLASLSMDGKGRALDKHEAARQKLMDLRSLFK